MHSEKTTTKPLAIDDGFFFGIGAFETIAVERGLPIFLEAHLQRLECTLDFFGIDCDTSALRAEIDNALAPDEVQHGRKVLKLTVTERNVLATMRENHYLPRDYERGFTCDISGVRRNETSPFTFHKTLNYGDCILEKRAAHERGIDEPLFLNSRGLLCEGATTNVFLVRSDSIITPAVGSGLLAGIMRSYVCGVTEVSEREVTYADAIASEEMFLTNSLLGIMPVRRLCDHEFASTTVARALNERYLRDIANKQGLVV
ncbi:MAG: branched-chain amino acid aminotransferase [Actinobacteria bacterium]|nr:branched-chain amino acid aminotransferase [Actinomycetota bacterium]